MLIHLLYTNIAAKLKQALPLALVVMFPALLYVKVPAQITDAVISGVIVDQNYAAIPGVSVTLLDKARARARQVVTDANGEFTFALLLHGAYLLRANCEGFSPVEVEVELDPFQPDSLRRAIRIQLQISELGEAVTVTAERDTREATSPNPTFTREFIERLPLSGQTLQSLIALSPGIVLTRASAEEQGQFSANGQRASANYFLVDGVSANTGVTANFSLGQAGAGSLPGLSATGGTNGLVSIEALQEFKLQSVGFAADSGRTPGALISISTRTGSGEFHGSAFDYFRHDALAANDWFANRDGVKKAALRQHDVGGALGGPLRLKGIAGRDSTRFFFSYEGLRLLQPLFGLTAVPSPGARAEATGAVKSLVNAYPLPNGENLGGGLARLSANYSDPTRLDAASIRFDRTINHRHTLFARFNLAPSKVSQRTGSLSRVLDTEFDQRSLTVGLTQSFGSRRGNDLRVNFSFAAGRSFNRLDNFGGATPPDTASLLPSFTNPQDAVTIIYVDGAQPLSLGKYADNTQRQFNLADNFALSSGAHQLRFGADYRRLSPNNHPASYDTAFNFIGVTGEEGFPAPLGTLLSATAFSAQISARDEVSLVFHNVSAYGQDSWQISSGVQMTFGLRWEFNPPPVATNGKSLYRAGDLKDLSSLSPTVGPLWQTDFGNFAPRIGAAWRLAHRQTGETTLRGGFGVFYDLGAGTVAANAASFPYFRNKSVFNIAGVPFPLKPSQAAAPAFSLAPPYGSFEVFDPQLQLPRTYHWDLTLEHQFDAQHLLSISYVGAAGRKLLRREAWRGVNSDFIAPLYVTTNAATSDYDALQVQFQRRLSQGLQLLTSYTWSHSLDLASNDSAPLTPAERLAPSTDRGSSDFDVRHLLTGAVTYDLPSPKLSFATALTRKWSVATLFRAQTAAPINVTYSRDIGFGFFPLRPDLVPGVPVFLNDPDAPGGKRLNNNISTVIGQSSSQVGAFLPAKEARQGTLGRNALRGFPFWQVDFALRRQFELTEKLKLQFRADVFNLFNHANFGSLNGALTDPFFGQSTSMLNRNLGTAGINGGLNPVFQVGGPRSAQLMLKLSF